MRHVNAMEQDHYPETLGALYVVHAGRVFGAVWAVVAPWLSRRTIGKVEVLAGADAPERLAALVGAGALPRALGGESYDAPYDRAEPRMFAADESREHDGVQPREDIEARVAQGDLLPASARFA